MEAVSGYGGAHDWLAGGARREASQARILEAATHLIAERGAAQVAIEDICDRVGCSRATLYRNIGGRPAILSALIAQRIIPVVEALRRVTATLTGDAQLVETILVAVHGVRADRVLFEAIKNVDREQMNQYLAAPELIASSDVCAAPAFAQDRLAANMLARIVWSLLDYPIDDPIEEHTIVKQFARALSAA